MAREPYTNQNGIKMVYSMQKYLLGYPTFSIEAMDMVVVDDWYQVKNHATDVSYRAVKKAMLMKRL